MSRLKLSIATSEYDHFRDLRFGLIKPEGIKLIWSTLRHHEIFARFLADRAWDIAELSLAKFSAEVTRDNPDIIGLPVIASRVFRFGAFYINRASGIRDAQDLRGRKVGVPEWAHTAAVYMKGWLQNVAGVPLQDISWVQAGANAPGRAEKVELALPRGVSVAHVADRSLSELLEDGEIDCAIIARPPDCFLARRPGIVRLFPDYHERDVDYLRSTGVWPIMHIIAIRRRVVLDHPWVVGNLFDAFVEAKRRSVERLSDPAVSRAPIAWIPEHVDGLHELLGEDIFPYGIEPNRRTLEQLMAYSYQQGIAKRMVKLVEAFAPGTEVRVVV